MSKRNASPRRRPVRKTSPRRGRDAVNHPTHYHAKSGIEVIDAIEAWRLGFSLGNAVKYIARADHKKKLAEDLKKARWYLDRAIRNVQRGKAP